LGHGLHGFCKNLIILRKHFAQWWRNISSKIVVSKIITPESHAYGYDPQ